MAPSSPLLGAPFNISKHQQAAAPRPLRSKSAAAPRAGASGVPRPPTPHPGVCDDASSGTARGGPAEAAAAAAGAAGAAGRGAHRKAGCSRAAVRLRQGAARGAVRRGICAGYGVRCGDVRTCGHAHTAATPAQLLSSARCLRVPLARVFLARPPASCRARICNNPRNELVRRPFAIRPPGRSCGAAWQGARNELCVPG